MRNWNSISNILFQLKPACFEPTYEELKRANLGTITAAKISF